MRKLGKVYEGNETGGFLWSTINTLKISIRFEVFTAVTMKNGVLWDVTPCGSCRNRRFGES
jgi:hypothetical protein